MSVSREGAALRSARKWLLLLCPEIPDRSGGKESLAIIVVKAAGYFGRSQRRHGMAYGAAGMQHGVAGAYKRRNTQGRVEGAFSYLSWRLCTGSCSAGSTRLDAGLRPPSIAVFGRSLPSAAGDRGSRPSAAAANRGIETDVATAIHECVVVDKNAWLFERCRILSRKQKPKILAHVLDSEHRRSFLF